MALRDQPYLPLYIQDFLTDEKLAECSASATGVYIRVMCLMHKSESYGKILLKQKYKQSNKQVLNFALMVAKNLPYELNVVQDGLSELLEENVLQIEGDYLIQKRMVNDGKLSDIRASTGSKGGKKTQKNNKDLATNFGKANIKANTEYEDINEGESEFVLKKGEKLEFELNLSDFGKIVEFVRILTREIITHDQITERWEAFKIESESEFYLSREKKINHFRNWLKNRIKNGEFKQSNSNGNGKLGTSAARDQYLQGLK